MLFPQNLLTNPQRSFVKWLGFFIFALRVVKSGKIVVIHRSIMSIAATLPPIEALAAIAALMPNKTASEVPAVATEQATPPPINAEVARNLGKVLRNLSSTGFVTFF